MQPSKPSTSTASASAPGDSSSLPPPVLFFREPANRKTGTHTKGPHGAPHPVPAVPTLSTEQNAATSPPEPQPMPRYTRQSRQSRLLGKISRRPINISGRGGIGNQTPAAPGPGSPAAPTRPGIRADLQPPATPGSYREAGREPQPAAPGSPPPAASGPHPRPPKSALSPAHCRTRSRTNALCANFQQIKYRLRAIDLNSHSAAEPALAGAYPDPLAYCAGE